MLLLRRAKQKEPSLLFRCRREKTGQSSLSKGRKACQLPRFHPCWPNARPTSMAYLSSEAPPLPTVARLAPSLARLHGMQSVPLHHRSCSCWANSSNSPLASQDASRPRRQRRARIKRGCPFWFTSGTFPARAPSWATHRAKCAAGRTCALHLGNSRLRRSCPAAGSPLRCGPAARSPRWRLWCRGS